MSGAGFLLSRPPVPLDARQRLDVRPGDVTAPPLPPAQADPLAEVSCPQAQVGAITASSLFPCDGSGPRTQGLFCFRGEWLEVCHQMQQQNLRDGGAAALSSPPVGRRKPFSPNLGALKGRLVCAQRVE